MEAQSALVRSDGAVELHTVAGVYMHLSAVVHPWHSEHDYALGLYKPLNELGLFKFRVLVIYVFD